MELKYGINSMPSSSNPCLNRTFMELKCGEPMTLESARQRLNRTFMELKYRTL